MTHAANERFAAHLFRQQHHLFTFLRHPGIDATNWQAEQALRPAAVIVTWEAATERLSSRLSK